MSEYRSLYNLRMGPNLTPWAGLCLIFAAYLISLLWVLLFQRRRFFYVFFSSYYKPSADPRGMVGRIYIGNYYPLLYTKYKSPGL